MKKAIIIFGLIFFSMQSYAQAGDLHFGLQGGYATYYKTPLYGLNISYDIANPLQISLTGLMNPKFNRPGINDSKEKWALYSANLDARLFLINMVSWATGPSLGGQYMRYSFTTIAQSGNQLYSDDGSNLFGFNIGWHLRINITDNLRATGGWRYTNMLRDKDGIKPDGYSLFYVSFGYAFNLF